MSKSILLGLSLLLSSSTLIICQQPAPAAPQSESYQCWTSNNLSTVREDFTFDFATHLATRYTVWENAAQSFKNLKFDESGDQLILRQGCGWSAKPLGCATINRKTKQLSLYAWGKNGGEDGPAGDFSGGPNVVNYDCNLLPAK